MEDTSVTHISGEMFLVEGLYCSISLFKIPQMCWMSHTWPGHSFHRNSCMFFAVCFGLCTCWNIYSSAKLLETKNDLVSQCVGISIDIHGAIYKCHLPSTHAAPCHHTPTSVLHCWDYAFTEVVLARFTSNMLDPIWTEQMYVGLFWPKNVLPILIKLLFMFFSSLILQLFAEELFGSDEVLYWSNAITVSWYNFESFDI